MFFGSYSHSLDDKNRLMIPSKMRESLSSKLFMMRGFDGAISVYEQDAFNALMAKLEKMAFLKERIRKLGKKHKYDISIITPPLYGSRKSHWDSELKKSIIDPGWCYDVNCSTESYLDWNFVASDDDRLERFLFSPKSFVIVGGDEYDETYKLEWEAKRSIDYEYERVGDYKNWGEHPPAYWDGENIPDYDEDLWGEQPNLPFSETPYYHI